MVLFLTGNDDGGTFVPDALALCRQAFLSRRALGPLNVSAPSSTDCEKGE